MRAMNKIDRHFKKAVKYYDGCLVCCYKLVELRIDELRKQGPLTLDRLAGLQKELRGEIQVALASGKYESLNNWARDMLGY